MTLLVAGVLWLGCTPDPRAAEAERAAAPAPIAERFPEALLDATWVVEVARPDALAPFADDRGWVSLVVQHDLADAVRWLGAEGGPAGARAHAEAAATYRQAALLAAHSLREVYGESPRQTDPAGAAHLLAVSHAVLGDREAAVAHAGELPARDPSAAWHAPWKAWLDSGRPWPPDLEALPRALPPPTPGRWPRAGKLPHYSLAERVPGRMSLRTMADPSLLVALAEWHTAASAVAAPGLQRALAAARAGYHWPAAPPAPAGPLPLAVRFGADVLVPGDGDFLVDLHAHGPSVIEAHVGESLLAWLAAEARPEGGGGVAPDRALDLALDLRDALVERSEFHNGGRPEGHHRQFADIAQVGVLRALALVAEVEGDREASGRLRIRAWEQASGATADPAGLLAFAAWDASNRYPQRALEILHAQASRMPSLEIARYGLDVLALRVGHERAGEPPGL